MNKLQFVGIKRIYSYYGERCEKLSTGLHFKTAKNVCDCYTYTAGVGWWPAYPHETAFIARCESLSIAIKIAFKHSIEYASENLSRISLNAYVNLEN